MLKKVVIGIIVIILIIIAIPVISGFMSTANPGGAIQKAQQRTEESAKLVIPLGYNLTTYKSQSVIEGNAFYTTKMTKGDSEITIVQKPNQTALCKGVDKVIGTIQTCYEEFPKAGIPTLKRITWNNNNMLNTITIADDTVTNSNIEELIASVE